MSHAGSERVSNLRSSLTRPADQAGSSSKPDYDRIALAAKQRCRCAKAGRVETRAVNISINRATRHRSDVLPARATNDQAVAADFLRPSCHEGNHSTSSAANGCSFGIQITNYIIWPIWGTKENTHCIFGVYEAACGDGPILLSPTIRSKIRYSAAAEKHTRGQQQISLHARDYAIRVNQFVVAVLSGKPKIVRMSQWESIAKRN